MTLVHPNKGPLKILEKRERGRTMQRLPKVLNEHGGLELELELD